MDPVHPSQPTDETSALPTTRLVLRISRQPPEIARVGDRVAASASIHVESTSNTSPNDFDIYFKFHAIYEPASTETPTSAQLDMIRLISPKVPPLPFTDGIWFNMAEDQLYSMELDPCCFMNVVLPRPGICRLQVAASFGNGAPDGMMEEIVPVLTTPITVLAVSEVPKESQDAQQSNGSRESQAR